MFQKLNFRLTIVVLLTVLFFDSHTMFAQFINHKTTTKSNIEIVTNYWGMIGYDIDRKTGGSCWPRGSQNQYIFGGGIWFGAKKTVDGETKTIVELSYNPNTGRSWMVPGRIEHGEKYNYDATDKYRVYSSSEFGKNNGEPYDSGLDNWPIWQTSHNANKSGLYIDNVTLRNKTSYPLGPAIKSDEDIFCTYKDTDLVYYEDGETVRRAEGCPLGLQFEQTLYSWDDPQYEDAIIVFYSVINTSADTLKDCWFASMSDPDLALKSNSSQGSTNDRSRYYNEDSEKNLAVFWTMGDRGEKGRGFGYLGLSLIMTPAVDEQGFLRKDNSIYNPSEQLGMTTFRSNFISGDEKTTAGRYDFMSKGVFSTDNEAGDKRGLLSTGPFNLRPGDTLRTALLINIALPVSGGDVGSSNTDELTTLVNNATLATNKFYHEIMIPVSVNEVINYQSDKMIANMYPNPATDNISVEFNLKTPATPRFEIINILGETVVKINNESFAAGSNIINIDTKSLASGSYYLKISVGAYQEVRMISVVR